MIEKKSGQKITLEAYKQEIKEMLAFIHKLCVENGIKYFVAFGTLLGTIRHDGFIPWDDDIDLWMPRADYEKFVDLLGTSTEDYYILSSENSPYYYNNFSRVCSNAGILKLKGIIDIDRLGPFIDIIPLDRAPEQEGQRLAYYERIRKAGVIVKYSLPSKYYRTLTPKRRIKMALNLPKRIYARYILGPGKAKEIRAQIMTEFNQTASTIYSTTFDRLSDKWIIYEEELNNLELHRFEDIEVMVPCAYDTILRRIFGDYMQLPPVEQRVTHHHFTPYWK